MAAVYLYKEANLLVKCHIKIEGHRDLRVL